MGLLTEPSKDERSEGTPLTDPLSTNLLTTRSLGRKLEQIRGHPPGGTPEAMEAAIFRMSNCLWDSPLCSQRSAHGEARSCRETSLFLQTWARMGAECTDRHGNSETRGLRGARRPAEGAWSRMMSADECRRQESGQKYVAPCADLGEDGYKLNQGCHGESENRALLGPRGPRRGSDPKCSGFPPMDRVAKRGANNKLVKRGPVDDPPSGGPLDLG